MSIANEGVEVAERLNALGYTVFVLTYRLPGEGWLNRADVPLQDAQRAMRLIRAKAEDFAIDGERISVIGFSAGGHLAGSLATAYGQYCYEPVDSADALSARPFGVALIYPVVTMKPPYAHNGSRRQLLGENPSEALVARHSVELNIDKQSPPIFLVHAMDDTGVSVENSLGLMRALREAHRPVEAHLLEEGGHGFGVGFPETPSVRWIELFDLWLQRLRLNLNP